MQYPRISGRGWFWGVMLTLFLWVYVGGRMVPAGGQVRMQAGQQIVGWPVQLLLVPGSWLATNVQGTAAWAVRSMVSARHSQDTAANLSEKVSTLEDAVKVRDGQITMLRERIRRMGDQIKLGIEPGDLLKANKLGSNPGEATSMLRIDKGSTDGVKEYDPVLSESNQIVGRVLAVQAKTSDVLLLPDRRMRVQAMLVRNENGHTRQLLKEPCVVEGLGNGEFGTKGVKTLDAQIRVGDVLLLHDESWPAKVQYFVLGTVSEVGLNPEQMLRYEVRTKANVNYMSSVQVLVK